MEICYIEHKNRNDNGMAWIAAVNRSKSGRTVYFNGKSLQKRRGIFSNYVDIETGDEYWISGVKKDRSDRHWAGSGKIIVDSSILSDYLLFTGQSSLPKSRYEIVNIKNEKEST